LVDLYFLFWKTLPFPRGIPSQRSSASVGRRVSLRVRGTPHRYASASPPHKSCAIFLPPPDISHTAMDTTTISLPMRWIFAVLCCAAASALEELCHRRRPPSHAPREGLHLLHFLLPYPRMVRVGGAVARHGAALWLALGRRERKMHLCDQEWPAHRPEMH
jgi:hypothetical protein